MNALVIISVQQQNLCRSKKAKVATLKKTSHKEQGALFFCRRRKREKLTQEDKVLVW
jgi:hypothetical protein